MQIYRLVLPILISLFTFVSHGANAPTPVKVVRLRVSNVVAPIINPDVTQVGFTVEGHDRNYYLSCYRLPGPSAYSFQFQGTYGAWLRVGAGHVVRDNGEFLTGLGGVVEYQECIKGIFEIRDQFVQPGAKVLVISSYANTGVSFDVQDAETR